MEQTGLTNEQINSKQYKVIQCHDLYHVATCRCPKRHLGIHEVSCNWAIETLFNINR
jgi:hypothetical protein